MNCGCCKELGCYAYGQTIDFGIESITDCGPYTFEIWANGAFSEIEETFPVGNPLQLPYTFNENSDTSIKIKLPSCLSLGSGIYYVTSLNGDCCFIAHGVLSQCV